MCSTWVSFESVRQGTCTSSPASSLPSALLCSADPEWRVRGIAQKTSCHSFPRFPEVCLSQVLLHLDRPSLLPSESLYRITSSHYVLGFYGRFQKAMAVREHSALCVNLPWKLYPLCCVLSLRAGPPEKLAWSSVLRNFLSPSVHRLVPQNQIDSWLCVSAACSWLEQDLTVSCDSFWDKTSHRFFTLALSSFS